jgi:predicted amidophosphoribosyltransferase
VQGDVAELAARAAESFGDTPEGASLRASLPTLRRSAGLCPRCAQPYAGIDEACPQCLAGLVPQALSPSPQGRLPSEGAS